MKQLPNIITSLRVAGSLATGFLLFIAVPMTFFTIIPITIVAAVATFAAIQEGYYIIHN